MPLANITPELADSYFTELDFAPDPWQREVILANQRRILLNCSRQAGKSTCAAILALLHLLLAERATIVIVSRSYRQSLELFNKVVSLHRRLGSQLLENLRVGELLLTTGSRLLALPCREDTIRGVSAVDLLILDEAARIPDNLYAGVRPMLAVTNGTLVCMSTPFGRRGFFYEAWLNERVPWRRTRIPAAENPRITAAFLDEERATLSEAQFQQEYCCVFTVPHGLVYPDFDMALSNRPTTAGPANVGGVDFGFRNPFAALWGHYGEGILYVFGEHYERRLPLSEHLPHLPKEVRLWHVDPAGANERAEMIRAGYPARAGNNSIRQGIATVTAWIKKGWLKIDGRKCPNLVQEASLYTYDDPTRGLSGEKPVDEHNHALAALRYLVMGLKRPAAVKAKAVELAPVKRPWLSVWNEELWLD